MVKVIKRDGTIQNFDMTKPVEAMKKPFTKGLKREVPEGLVEAFVTELEGKFEKCEEEKIDIEVIQDFIRDFLMKHDECEAAENFILYRDERSEYRESQSKLQKNIATKLYAKNIVNQNANIDEASFGGRLGEAANTVAKDYALKHVLSKMARKNHESNEIYIHDLDSYVIGDHNCLTYPMDKSLNEGVTTRQADIRPANSINTAMQLVAVYFQIQSLQQFGGVAAGHLDTSMVPFYRKSFNKHYREICDTIPLCSWMTKRIEGIDIKNTSIEDRAYISWNPLRKYIYNKAIKRTNKELKQASEGLIHNLNSLQSRSGNQLPFSSINYGACTLPEGRAVTDSILEATLNGTGPHNMTAIFPCGIFQWDPEINAYPGTPNYDLYRKALKCTSRRIYPNYANCTWSVQKEAKKYDLKCRQEVLDEISNEDYNILIEKINENPKYARERFYLYVDDSDIVCIDKTVHPCELMGTMGCRTWNGGDVWFKNSFKNNIMAWIYDKPLYDDIESAIQKDGRGNICPVTIILPTLAMESKEYALKKNPDATKDDIFMSFMKHLNKKIEEARDMLIERYNYICTQSPDAAKFMYQNRTMSGYVPDEGIQSALRHGTLVIGQLGLAEALKILVGADHSDHDGMRYACKIETLFQQRCAEFKKALQLNIGVYYTPAENLCHTAMKKFKAKYGVIPGISDKEYFTNSMHIPVIDEMSIYRKIDLESQLTGYSSAGCITYVEVDSSVSHNVDAMENIVNYMMEHDIPYGAVNIPLDSCPNCHAQGDFNGKCPVCGCEDVHELRRVTGYLSTTKKHFNKGKQHEVDNRVKHTGISII